MFFNKMVQQSQQSAKTGHLWKGGKKMRSELMELNEVID